MDNLEKFVRDNRDPWDDRKAPSSAWDRIEKELDTSAPKINGRPDWSKMLMALIGIAVVIGLIYVLRPTDRAVEENELLQFAEVPEYQETEQYYRSTIELNLVILKNISADATLLEDLSQLDEIEQELRAEYSTAQGTYKEEILHALIMNHRTKLGLLERMLEQIKNTKNENDELF